MLIIITGPTASGKTNLAERMAKNNNCKIINGDMAQMYSMVSVGTAKPEETERRGALFDIIETSCGDIKNTLKNMTAIKYKTLVEKEIIKIKEENQIPVVVGGSLYYLKNLMFELKGSYKKVPKEILEKLKNINLEKEETNSLWNKLNEVDKERAIQIHENDRYRICRALEIIIESGALASSKKEEFEPMDEEIKIIGIVPEIKTLEKRIKDRLNDMLDENGWILETERLNENEAKRELVLIKGFIGYEEILKWINDGKKKEELPGLKEEILIKTRNYAKRQLTFWRGLKKKIKEVDLNKKIQIIEVKNENEFDEEKIKCILKLKEKNIIA